MKEGSTRGGKNEGKGFNALTGEYLRLQNDYWFQMVALSFNYCHALQRQGAQNWKGVMGMTELFLPRPKAEIIKMTDPKVEKQKLWREKFRTHEKPTQSATVIYVDFKARKEIRR